MGSACARRAPFRESLERDAVGIVRRRNAAIERDQKEHFADFIGRAAAVQRAIDVHLELGGPIQGGGHPDDHQAACPALQPGTRPDIAVRIGVDDVLQWRTVVAGGGHALLDRLVPENFLANGKTAPVEFLQIHRCLQSWGKSMIRALKRVLAAALLSGAAATAGAQAYPTHVVKLVVPYGPGSSPDQVGRIVAQQMQEALGQPVIVENRAGALANVGTAEVARAAPDGYTVLLTTNTPHAANVALFKKLPFDPVRDFAPIVRLITTSMVLLVRSDFPASTLQEFIAHAKAKPGGLSAGYGSAATIVSIAKLRSAAGFKTLDVPYKGVPLAITDVLGGQVDFTLGDLAVSMPQIQGGKMKGLAVTSPLRTPLAPELPAIAELFPGYETRIW